MKNNIIHKHREDGGTGITNFDTAEMQKYVDAAGIYNTMVGQTALVVSDITIECCCKASVIKGGSLHQLEGDDLSAFWEIFDTIELLHELDVECKGWLNQLKTS